MKLISRLIVMGRKEDRASIAGPSCSTFSQVSCAKVKQVRLAPVTGGWVGGGLHTWVGAVVN